MSDAQAVGAGRPLSPQSARAPGAAPIWDTHCHLGDARFDGDRDDVFARAQAAGLAVIVVVAADPVEWSAVAALRGGRAARRPALRFAFGLHPHEARQAGPSVWARLEGALADAAALGEIGLDYHYDHSPRNAQREAFRVQLTLARRLGLPVILHEREAADDVLAILDAEGVPPAGGVWHSFSGDPALAGEAINRGLHVGFGGLVTFAKGTDALRAAASACPLERMLLETDAPYLSPVPYRGRRNEPARVADVAQFVARLRQMPVTKLRARTSDNACRLFGAPAGAGATDAS